ncbi:TIGR03620 family F420-dependent LLM class oxidoreductase [Glaciibacter sp. 2TAF33]|uniref:TIGR03620 family F420-dependent LLM class oxidoreductase n=1 Tax=Glaciibacter sp. 2TAF33 TaxID=3233015 RepID=UPI003F92BE8E
MVHHPTDAREKSLSAVREGIRDRLGRYGLWRMGRDTGPSFGIAADRYGFGSVWYGGVGADLGIPSQVLAATDRIVVGSGIVNIFATDPNEVAASYHRLQAQYPGRFVLGIGLGHPERTERAKHPLGALSAFLDALVSEGVPAGRVVVAGLGPRVLALSGEQTGGAHPYLVTPGHTRWAREILGESPLLIPEQRLVLEVDRERALMIARSGVEFYLGLRNYRLNLQRMGISAEELDDPWPRVTDAIVVSGTPGAVKAGLDAHLDAGADHVLAQIVAPEGSDPIEDVAALAAALGLTPR